MQKCLYLQIYKLCKQCTECKHASLYIFPLWQAYRARRPQTHCLGLIYAVLHISIGFHLPWHNSLTNCMLVPITTTSTYICTRKLKGQFNRDAFQWSKSTTRFSLVQKSLFMKHFLNLKTWKSPSLLFIIPWVSTENHWCRWESFWIRIIIPYPEPGLKLGSDFDPV